MDSHQIAGGLIFYLGLVALLTFHEFAHAWVGWKCGDDTARLQGRLSLNPLVHIDPVGTVIMPLFMIFGPSNITRFALGWAKPVPVNVFNLRNKKWDDILVAMAGPAMNLILAVVLVALARVALLFGSSEITNLFLQIAYLSLLLCFFNLIPIPPLDGSHVLRNFIGMSYETYWRLCQHVFINLILIMLVLQIPFVREALTFVTSGTLALLTLCFDFPPMQ